MKRTYESPKAEVVRFQYRDQVVAASGVACTNRWTNLGEGECIQGEPVFIETLQA